PCAGRVRLPGHPDAELRTYGPPARPGTRGRVPGPGRPDGRRLHPRGGRGGVMRIQLVRAWPRRHEIRGLELADGATVGDALRAVDWADTPGCGIAVFGVVAGP